jgi:hypothetical protein
MEVVGALGLVLLRRVAGYRVAVQPVSGTERADPGLDLALQRLEPGELVHPAG